MYDEVVRRSEDIDLNGRLRAMGGRTLLVPSIIVKYHVRATFTQFCRHALSNGYWVTFPALAKGTRFSGRHLAPFALVTSQLALAALCSTALDRLRAWLWALAIFADAPAADRWNAERLRPPYLPGPALKPMRACLRHASRLNRALTRHTFHWFSHAGTKRNGSSVVWSQSPKTTIPPISWKL